MRRFRENSSLIYPTEDSNLSRPPQSSWIPLVLPQTSSFIKASRFPSMPPFVFIWQRNELFYKGQLLSFHAPPRIQMVEKLEKSVCFESQQKVLEAYADSNRKYLKQKQFFWLLFLYSAHICFCSENIYRWDYLQIYFKYQVSDENMLVGLLAN